MDLLRGNHNFIPCHIPLLTNNLFSLAQLVFFFFSGTCTTGKGGKNRRRGKGDGEESKRELEFKEDGKFGTNDLVARDFFLVCRVERTQQPYGIVVLFLLLL
jgi:hypothetical protein